MPTAESRVAAACAALKDLSAVLWQCQNPELGPLLARSMPWR